ncbi:uncharacterized protein LOC134186799 [Corticium candelabrum]|uniref:uncharacterized protein LOC134186799 n=1 Tax=Corticium candelabrum TaxID=121492 RepID=UPI002E25DA55|nr:uncharacterized protein LOC134186799 [Corticium candelabrum]
MAVTWGERMLSVVHRCDAFNQRLSKDDCIPFCIGSEQYGLVREDCWRELAKFPDVFVVDGKEKVVKLSEQLGTVEKRTEKVNEILMKLREDEVFHCLKGWRNEMYPVSKSYHAPPVFLIERAGAGLLGIKQYGCHLNGYFHTDESLLMWISRRSLNKPTFPDKLDNLAAGGLPVGMKVKDNIVKECYEEAAIPTDVASRAISVGSISYFFEDERGLFPETQFLFDLELAPDFKPVANDGEVEQFYCWPLDQVKEEISSGSFKPNCALVVLDFLIRHGYVTADNEQLYEVLVTSLHRIHPF